jgi:uncharacterized RDD family membrane protein YckC
MNNENPFRAPSSSVADVPEIGGLELAGRGHRFGAATIDGFIEMFVVLPCAFAIGIFDFAKLGQGQTIMFNVEIGILTFASFILIQGYFLKKNGQTIGKKIVGIRIVDLDENVPGLWTLLGRRYAPIFIAQIVPIIGPFLGLVDDLFVFKSDRRCIHDHIAKTKVVAFNPRFSSGTWFVMPFVIMFVGAIVIGIAAAIIIHKLHLSPPTLNLPAGSPKPEVVVPQANPVPVETVAQPAPSTLQATPEIQAPVPVTDTSKPQAAEPLKEPGSFPKISQGGLAWMQISNSRKTWADANAYCTNIAIGWRLPTKDELNILYASRAMNGQGWTLSGTWSSTPSGNGSHYNVDLNVGDVYGINDTNKDYVTCVH